MAGRAFVVVKEVFNIETVALFSNSDNGYTTKTQLFWC